ncbi:MAG: hypothetical protein IBX71_10895, partial [Candidatus Desulforudis sp.]|nr:hypothetical protein [Desulforudis sp.]
MILYTICDIESVLDTSINVASPLENGVVGGVPVVLRRESGGAAFIDRVLSTNP